jgi:hypothetical protein
MRVRWLRRILECMLELVALLGVVVAVWMPRALVFEAAGVFLRVLLRRALDGRESVVWLALAVGTRVVVVVVLLRPPWFALLPLPPPAFCLVLPRMASYLVFALSSSSAQDVIMSLRWGMDLGRRRPKSSKVRRW